MNNLFGLGNPEESPQLMQGLLGSAGETNHSFDEVTAKNTNAARQLGQLAQSVNPSVGNEFLAQKQNSTQQLAQQAMIQQQQQGAQNLGLLAQIARIFFK